VEKETQISNWGKDFMYTTKISAVKTVLEFVSDMMSYLVLRGRWCNIIVLNVHTPS
jgi:hypothetical protein